MAIERGRADARAIGAALRHLAISSHGNPFFGVAGPPYLAEGEMAVVQPLGKDFEAIARVKAEDWAGLVAVAKLR